MSLVFSSLRGRRGSKSGFVTVVAILALLLTQTGVLARLQASPTDPSPAKGHASVIAQGVAEMPYDPIAWRVVADTAEPLESAEAVERALGFVVTTTDGVNLADETSGLQQRLAPGEAAFVSEGSIQIRASLSDQSVPYLRVGLVADDQANDPGNDELVFGGEPFTAPSGQRDIDLVRDVLTDGEQSKLAASDFPTLVIATTGSITVDAGDSPATLTAGQAAQFSGAITIIGSGDSSSFVAGIIGPEVPKPPRTTGTVTLGVYLCAPGVTPDDLGNPVVSTVASGCDAVTTGVATTVTVPDSSTLSLDDADAGEGGAFAWTGLGFGDYSIASPSSLPAGAADPTFVDKDGNVVSSGDLSIDSASPDARLDLYLFQSASTGSITVTVYNCPNGIDADTASSQSCDPADPSDVSVTAPDGSTLSISDATASDGSLAWTGLGVSSGDSSAGDYAIQATLPDGYSSTAVDGASPTDTAGSFTVSLTGDTPNATVSLFNLVQPTGTITVDTIVCPDGADNPDTCVRDFGPSGLSGVFIHDAAGNNAALTEGNASLEGDGPYVWANIPLGDYAMDSSGLVPPDGYEIAGVVLTPDGTDVSGGFSVTANVPIANIVVLLQPTSSGGVGTATADPDSDNDGLTGSQEANAGTDPANPDSDGDCHSDGAEVAAGTDPLDDASVPTGDCDIQP